MLKVGSKFFTFDDLSKRLEEFQQIERVQLWVRDSRTVVAAAKRARRKCLNPDLKYAELTYSCVFGGRRPSDQTKTHNQTSAGGCPFKVRLSTSNDGQALVVKEICHNHNHEPGKKLHDEPRRLCKNKAGNRSGETRKPCRYVVNKQRVVNESASIPCVPVKHHTLSTKPTITSISSDHQEQQQQLSLQLERRLQKTQLIHRQTSTDIVQIDSPEHSDTPDYLRSPEVNLERVASNIVNNDHYSYHLPPSPISPPSSSLSSLGQTGFTSDEDEPVEPILGLDEVLVESLGDLDNVADIEFSPTPTPTSTAINMSINKNSLFDGQQVKHLTSTLATNNIIKIPTLVSDQEPSLFTTPFSTSPNLGYGLQSFPMGIVGVSEDETSSVLGSAAKRQKVGGRIRKQSFTTSIFESGSDIPDLNFSLNDLMEFDVTLF